MAERLVDILKSDQTFSPEDQKLLETLGYKKQGFWWAKDGRMASKMELAEAINKKKPQKPEGSQYPLPLWMFTYDAKHKATLNIWDTFPLVFVTGMTPGGFSGINIHYIDPGMRMQLLQELFDHFDDGGSPASALEMISMFNIGYKKYLNTHVRTARIQIPRSMWEEAFTTPGKFIIK